MCDALATCGETAKHNKTTIYVGSQIPYADRDQAAAALGKPADNVRVVATLMGGGFGGKEDITGQIHAALLAEATGRPVKMLYSRQESLLVHPKRHATIIRMRTGATRDGKLTAVEATLYGDGGAYASLSEKVLTRATTHASGPYDVPNVKVDCFATYTNNVPAGAFRGFGVTQSCFAVESNMDMLAEKLGLDAVEFRRINALDVGSETSTGQVMRESVGLNECIDKVDADMRARIFAGPGTKAIGACSPGAWPSATRTPDSVAARRTRRPPRSKAWQDPDKGLLAEVRISSAEMGQGLPGVLAACAAEELGIPAERQRAARRHRFLPGWRPDDGQPPDLRQRQRGPPGGARTSRRNSLTRRELPARNQGATRILGTDDPAAGDRRRYARGVRFLCAGRTVRNRHAHRRGPGSQGHRCARCRPGHQPADAGRARSKAASSCASATR